jgi:hypothetical protein
VEKPYRLSDYGKFVGIRLLDLIVLREKSYKRDVKLLNILIFIKSTVWKSLFGEAISTYFFYYDTNSCNNAGKEADKLEKSNDDPCKCTVRSSTSSTLNKIRLALISINSDFLIEREPIVNTYISLSKDKSSLNCASFIAGIVEAFLTVPLIHMLPRCLFNE